MEEQIEKLKREYVKPKPSDPFVDPIKEFSRASKIESEVRNWLTYPVEERKRRVKDDFRFIPQMQGDPPRGIQPESDLAYQGRLLERWRGLCVIIQEESRAKAGNRCVEAAIGAFKQLFPDYKSPEK